MKKLCYLASKPAVTGLSLALNLWDEILFFSVLCPAQKEYVLVVFIRLSAEIRLY